MVRYKRMTGGSSSFRATKEEGVPVRSRTAEDRQTLITVGRLVEGKRSYAQVLIFHIFSLKTVFEGHMV